MDHSLNFSITNLAHTNRPCDLESLNLSKSENRSFVLQEKSSIKEKSITTSNIANNTDLIKYSEKSAQSMLMTVTAPTAPVVPKAPSLDKLETPKPIQQQSTYSQPPPDITHIPDADISDPFDDFEAEKRGENVN
jgi:hypothetical protein